MLETGASGRFANGKTVETIRNGRYEPVPGAYRLTPRRRRLRHRKHVGEILS